jgi:hypothetical protein
MKLFKKGWWKIQPKGSGNGANAFMFMDEIFHPAAHEARLEMQEESRKLVLDENGDDPKITIKIPKNSKPEERA